MTLPTLIEAIAIGLVLSVAFAEFFGFSAAGLVVPGYIAYHLNEPLHIIIIAAATLATLTVEKLVGQVMILYGRRLLALDALLSVAFVYGIEHLLVWLGFPIPVLMDTIGYFIPALIVIFFGSSGVLNTLSSIVIISVIVRFILVIFKL